MSDGAVVRAQLYRAAEKADEAANQMRGAEHTALNDVFTAVRSALTAVENSAVIARQALESVVESRALANPILVGSADSRVSTGISQLNEIERDQEDMIVKLRFIKEELEKITTGILPVAIQDASADAVKANSAAGYFRGYAADVP